MNATSIRDAHAKAGAAGIRWAAPDMSILSAGRSAPPPMPPALFGTVWPLISDLAEGAGAPVDYVAMGVLAVAASLVGGKRRVRPFAESNWKEPCVLWVAVVGDPSSNKSPALDAATGPLREMESDHAERHKTTRRDYETRAERAKQERRQWEESVKAATKASEITPERPESADEPDEPQRRRLLVNDATPEAVGAILSGNPSGVMVMRDELAGWLMSFDRYSPGGREFWLEAHRGEPHVIDRKGSPLPLRIPFNGVTVLGGIQPEKLADCILAGSDDGLVARFLWAWPDQIPFQRPRNVANIAELDAIYRRLDALCFGTDQNGERRAIVLPLSAGAADTFVSWVKEHAAGIGDAASLFKGFCGKLNGIVLRLALASELMRWGTAGGPEPREIGAETVAAAIGFVEDYAKPMAMRVFGDAALAPVERNAAMLARFILKLSLVRVNARELRRTTGLPPSLRDAAMMDEALEQLAEADWLMMAPRLEREGRPRKDYLVNPAVHEAGLG